MASNLITLEPIRLTQQENNSGLVYQSLDQHENKDNALNGAQLRVKRTERIVNEVQKMELKHIRQIMSMLCDPDVTSDHFLPQFGFTFGEFCVAYVVRQN